MSRDDDEVFAAKKPGAPRHVLGETLDALSVDELAERIAALREEIERLEAAKARKDASRAAAASFFKS